MRRLSLATILLAQTLFTLGQGTIMQSGVTYRYNGKNQRTPLGKVYIKVAASANGVLSDSVSGRFSLQLPNMKMGSRIGNVTVQKRGMMVFNQQAVDEWSIRQDPLCVILCDKDEFEKQKQNLIAIGQREAQKRYDNKISEIEAKYKAESEEWFQKISEAENELQNFQKQIGKYAELFARIDLSEVSYTEQRILDLVQQGRIDEAIKTYDDLNLLEKFEEETSSYKSLNKAAQQIEKEKKLAKRNIEELYAAINRNVSILMFAEETGKAKTKLLSLLDKITPLFNEHPDEYRPWMAKTQFLLGKAMCELGDYEKSKQHYLTAIEQYTILYDAEPELYIADLANARKELSNQYWADNFEGVVWNKEHLMPTISLFEQLYGCDSDKYGQSLAELYRKLGDCYNNYYIGNDNVKAEDYYLKANKLYTELALKQPEKYGGSLACDYVHLSIFYKEKMQDAPNAKLCERKAAECYFTALESSTEVLLQHPEADAKEWNYLMSIPSWKLDYNMDNLVLQGLIDTTKIEKFYLYTIDRLTQLEKQDSEEYGKYLIDATLCVAKYYNYYNKVKEEEKYIIKAEELAFNLFNMTPQKYRDYYAYTEDKLRTFYEHKNNLKVENSHLKELRVYTLLFKKDTTEYARYLIGKNRDIGHYYSLQGNYPKAEEYYLKEIELCTTLFNQKPLRYGKDLARALYRFADYYDYPQKDKTKQEEYRLKEIVIWEKLFNLAPENEGWHYVNSLELMGDFYRYRCEDYAKAEEFYLKKLEIVTMLNSICLNSNYFALTSTLSRLGYFYADKLHDNIKAEEFFLKELEIKMSLYNQNPEENCYSLAHTLEKVAEFYKGNMRNNSKAEEYYLKKIDIYMSLFKQDPSHYQYVLSESLKTMIAFYKETIPDPSKAEGCYQKLIDVYTILFNKDPEKWRTYLASRQEEMGDFYFENENYNKAEELYLLAKANYDIQFEKSPKSLYRYHVALIQYSLMRVYLEDNSKIERYDAMLSDALSNFEVLYQENKTYKQVIVVLRNLKGRRYLIKGKIDDALSLFESTYQIDPEASVSYLASGYNAKAYDFAKVRDYSKAIETIDKAISLKPGNANYYDSKGEILLMKGDEQGAVKMWQKVIELDPDFLSKHNGSTELYKQMKERGLIE